MRKEVNNYLLKLQAPGEVSWHSQWMWAGLGWLLCVPTFN